MANKIEFNGMTVAELINKLQSLDPNMELATIEDDGETNPRFIPAAGIFEVAAYYAEWDDGFVDPSRYYHTDEEIASEFGDCPTTQVLVIS